MVFSTAGKETRTSHIKGVRAMHQTVGDMEPVQRLSHVQSSVEPYGDDPLIVKEAKGVYVVDTHDRRYLDAVSGYWVACLGYGDEELAGILASASRRLAYWHHCGTVHEPVLNYVEELSNHLAEPLRGKILFAATGSGAMENALRVACARDVQIGRKTIVGHLDRGYHGSTFLTQQLSSERWNDWPVSLRLASHQTVSLPTPQTAGEADETLNRLEASLRQEGSGPSIVVTEPILGVGGVLEPPREFFRALAELLRRHDVTWISDEISTGFGATGRLFAYEISGAIPDILVVGKKMSAGYFPITAAIVSAELSAAVLTDSFHYGYSFSGHPVGCEVARAVLKRIATEEMLTDIRAKGDILMACLREAVGDFLGPSSVRGRGLMVSVDLSSGAAAREACKQLRALGVYEIPEGRYLVYSPPYIITEEEIRWLARATGSALSSTASPRKTGSYQGWMLSESSSGSV